MTRRIWPPTGLLGVNHDGFARCPEVYCVRYEVAECVTRPENALHTQSGGQLARSGTLQRVLAWQTALSSMRHGSLPSAETMFSLPFSVPSSQRLLAAWESPSKGITQPGALSLLRS